MNQAIAKENPKGKEREVPLPPGAISAPLSFAQERLWFFEQLEPDAVLLNIPMGLRLRGRLEIPLLVRCLEEIVRRQAMLRVTIHEGEDGPRQVIHPALDIPLTIEDLSSLPQEEGEEQAAALVAREARRKFDLESGPLLRILLIRMADGQGSATESLPEHICLLTMHHIISDGWSMGVLVRELAALYVAFGAGKPSPLPPLPLQYHEFARRQRDELAQGLHDEAMAYWRQALAGLSPHPLLTPDNLGEKRRARLEEKPGAGHGAGVLHAGLSLRLSRDLLELSRQRHASPYMCLLAAWAVLFSRHAASDDIVLGSLIANRDRAELEPLVGFFVNTLPLRLDLSGSPTFEELLGRVRDRALDAYAHQELPFEKIVEIAQPVRSEGEIPLVQVMVIMQNAPIGELVLPGLTVQSYPVATSSVRFDLEIYLWEQDGCLKADLVYKEGLFSRFAIERLWQQLEIVLSAMVAADPRPVAAIPLLSADQQARLQQIATGTIEPRPPLAIHELVAAQARKSPEAVAVSQAGGGSLSYRELERDAGRIARALMQRGVGPGSRVGLSLEPSPELLAVLLGILQAGGLYVPLDPLWPLARTAFVIKDCGISLLVVDPRREEDLRQALLGGGEDEESATGDMLSPATLLAAAVAEAPPLSRVDPAAGAYLIYTSGSTGQPKGVLVEHRNVVNYICWALEQYGDNRAVDFPLFSSLAFDLTVTSLFVPLISGGTVRVYPQDPADPTPVILRVVADDAVDVVKLTPAHLALVREAGFAPRRIRALVVGGEELKVELARAIHQSSGGRVAIYNEYGPTETTVGCMIHRFDPSWERQGSVSVGSAIANTEVAILDENLTPVPPGMSGELWVGGAGVARGYLGRDELTAQRFRAIPSRPALRWYRSGDLARWEDDGRISCLGRADRQLKIRGYRIEPGEIESALMSHPRVRSAAVVGREARTSGPAAPEHKHCRRCGMPADYPQLSFDGEGVCNFCRDFAAYSDRALGYFRKPDDLYRDMPPGCGAAHGTYDCLVLFSGGKDSTYMLYQLARMGYRILVFTLDNGYLYESALANIRATVARLRLDYLISKPDSMPAILHESLVEYSNVCNGCFKSIYTAAIQTAMERKIPCIVTGLSRGQLFETRLGELFGSGVFDDREIDAAVLEARKAYHRMDDAVLRTMAGELFASDEVFEKIKFIDFYRYSDVTRAGILDFLRQQLVGINLTELGCSTNCVVNDAGIFVHRRERGFHNYALPGSWEVRIGHRSREDFIAELAVAPDMERVPVILRELSYSCKAPEIPERLLAAFYSADQPLSQEELRGHLGGQLPPYMVPAVLVQMEALPLTGNGKVDYSRLEQLELETMAGTPAGAISRSAGSLLAPRTAMERGLAAIWSEVLNRECAGINEDFFAIGGHSLAATRVAARIRRRFGVDLPLRLLFVARTIAELAAALSAAGGDLPTPAKGEAKEAQDQAGTGLTIPRLARREQAPLSPAQERLWFIEQLEDTQGAYTVAAAGYLEGELDHQAFGEALQQVVGRHEILRTTFGEERGVPFQKLVHAAVATGDLLRYHDLESLGAEFPEQVSEQLLGQVTGKIPGSASGEFSGTAPEMAPEIIQEQWLRKLSAEPFDLRKGPLLRVGLLGLEDRRHLLLVAMHHIITDGWSLGVLFKELAHGYRQLTAPASSPASPSSPKPLPPLEIQYADYAAWQRARSEAGEFDSQVTYFARRLAGAPPLLTLPTDRPRTAGGHFRGATASLRLHPELVSGLKALAGRTGSTLFVVTLAGFALLLSRHSRQDDLVIGTPVANREIPELEGLIGFFVNTIALRIKLDGELSAEELIRRLQDDTLDDFAHQQAPFARVVEACVKERNLGHSPLFQVMFAFQNAPLPEAELGGCRFTPLALKRESTHFDLGFFLAENQGAIEITYEYSSELFAAESMARLARQYMRVLEGMVQGQALPVSRISLLSARERAELVASWADSPPAPIPATVVELFARQCRSGADKVAIRQQEQSLSYGELERRAEQLAHHLRSEGVGRDRVVALALNSSPEQIVALLAILKAGGACMPLDLSAPPQRIKGILADSGVGLLLTNSELDRRYGFSTTLVDQEQTRVILSDRLFTGDYQSASSAGGPVGSDDARAKAEAGAPLPRLEDLAYVLYTSGSTGKPKGVAMPHGPLANLVDWQLAQPGFGSPAVTLQFAPLSFDVSFQEIFCTLCSGGTLVLIDEEIRRDGGMLLDLLSKFRVARLFLPFVALQQLALAATRKKQFPAILREVVTAGEQLRLTEPIRHFFTNLPHCRLHNQYGPTECHVVTALTLSGHPGAWPALPTIGSPIANAAIYILDSQLEPLPVGVLGELFIGGEVCARGYLNQPELTAQRFLPDPFRSVSGRCMYSSGDLARYLPDGSIEFFGRVDHQVKIRGFRVELQEIESVLNALPMVQECAVTVQSPPEGGSELVAHIVLRERQAGDSRLPASDNRASQAGSARDSLPPGEEPQAVVRAALAARLPPYMVPRFIVPLALMPLTSSGKIDRQALTLPLGIPSEATSVRALAGAPAKAHADPTEAIVAELWARILGLEMVAAEENFFELGGHSLLATQLISEINELFSLELPVRYLFDYPTVSALARQIKGRFDGVDSSRPPLRAQAHGNKAPLSFAQERLWLMEQSLNLASALVPAQPPAQAPAQSRAKIPGHNAVYNMPVALRCAGALDVEALERAIAEIIARHHTLRTLFSQDQEGQPVQMVQVTIPFALARHELSPAQSLEEREAALEKMALSEAGTPFDLEQGPLIRAGVIRVGADDWVILLTFHHIICDGWSIGLFSRELGHFYRAHSEGRTPALEPLPIQYLDFAAWQRQLLAGPGGAQLRRYWEQQLAGVPLQLELPADFPRPAVTSHAGARYSFTLEPEIHRALQEFSRRNSSTLFMTMLAAFAWLIFRYSGQERFLIGTPIANRNHKLIEPLIGFFVNMLPLKIDLSADPTLEELVGALRRTSLDAYTHQDLPFDEMVRMLQPERSLNRHPLIQVVFVLQNAPVPPLYLGNAALTPLGREQTVAKYDLLLSLTPDQGVLHGAVEYSSELFSEGTIRGLVELYTRLLAELCANPRARVLDGGGSSSGPSPSTESSGEDECSFDFFGDAP